MGKLLTGRWGEPPEAESVPISLKDCNQKLGMKPSDFVSAGTPTFFEKKHGAAGRYLVFLSDADEVAGSPLWKSGYYLLPIEAIDVLKALKGLRVDNAGKILPVQVESDETPPAHVQEALDKWVAQCQPLFFKCRCDHLELRVKKPWGLRRRWKVRLRCPDRCQPVQSVVL